MVLWERLCKSASRMAFTWFHQHSGCAIVCSIHVISTTLGHVCWNICLNSSGHGALEGG
jgi:hypothetical protein